MQFAFLIHESPEFGDAAARDESDPYVAAWRSYYKALVAVSTSAATLQGAGKPPPPCAW